MRVTPLCGRRACWRGFVVAFGLVLVSAAPAPAQTLDDALTFLFTNRSIATDDFVRDQQAAVATRDTIAKLLVTQLATIPISPSAGGFTYRFDPSLGVAARSSTSFGPFFSERSLTVGARRLSFGVGYQQAVFTRIDDRSLRNGTLVSTSSQLGGEASPFDVETVSLAIRSDTTILSGNVGITDRLDLGVALPMVRIDLHGDRVDTYRGTPSTQAVASAVTTGPGDVQVRAKYNVLRGTRLGLAGGLDVGVPTGDEANLLGLGHSTATPHAIVSFEGDRIGVHGNLGATFGNGSPELDYRGAVTFVGVSRLTVIGEVAGHRQSEGGRLTYVTTPHPTLPAVQTTRLTSTGEATNRTVAIAGLKWNLYRSLLLNLQALTPLTRSGLYAAVVPSVTIDYFFEP